MGLFRPGTRIRFWDPGYRSKPAVRPPGLLLLASIGFLLSAISVPIYAVALALDSTGSVVSEEAMYVAILHFLLPLGVVYAVSTNSPLSRILVAVYTVILATATILGKGLLGNLDVSDMARTAASIAVGITVFLWLWFAPRMQLYYLLLLDRPLPDGLRARAPELLNSSGMSLRIRQSIEWLADHLETIVLVGFILITLYAVFRTGSSGT